VLALQGGGDGQVDAGEQAAPSIRSFTEPHIGRKAPDKIAAAVMSATGAAIAWIAVTAVGFTSSASDRSVRTKHFA
jgi:hypothetical protein